jgi:hypothetical protein
MRNDWEFHYKSSSVLEATKKKIEHHHQRREWWSKEQQKAEEHLKKKGFEYRERARSHGADIEIVGDPELARRLTYCQRKVEEHLKQEELYSTWSRGLELKVEEESEEKLSLTIEDIQFFGL